MTNPVRRTTTGFQPNPSAPFFLELSALECAPADYSQLLRPFGLVVLAGSVRLAGGVGQGWDQTVQALAREEGEAPDLKCVSSRRCREYHSAATHQDQHSVLVDWQCSSTFRG